MGCCSEMNIVPIPQSRRALVSGSVVDDLLDLHARLERVSLSNGLPLVINRIDQT
jgi:hypothetical protein